MKEDERKIDEDSDIQKSNRNEEPGMRVHFQTPCFQVFKAIHSPTLQFKG